MKYAASSIFAVISAGLTYLVGGFDVSVMVLVAFMALDYITGVINAINEKKLSSDIGFKGLAKKLFIVVMLVMAVFLDRLISGGQWIVRSLVAYFYIANEGISIMENIARLGVPLPEKVKDILEQLKNK